MSRHAIGLLGENAAADASGSAPVATAFAAIAAKVSACIKSATSYVAEAFVDKSALEYPIL